jgi:hypothetical protein
MLLAWSCTGLFVKKTRTEHDRTSYIIWLVVWNMFYFPFHIWDVILPIDELILFKMVKTC